MRVCVCTREGNALYSELRGKVKYVKGDLDGAKADLKPLGQEKWHGLFRDPTTVANMAKVCFSLSISLSLSISVRARVCV